jgi:ATP-binding cassette subfamily C (CFTR/MRP) protein 4
VLQNGVVGRFRFCISKILNILITGYYGGDVGLAITQAIGLTGLIQKGIRQSAELENQMTAVERVLEYSQVEKEPPLESRAGKK